jgi:hypothetical protein
MTTHNNPKRQTSMPPAGFEPAILAIERPQTHALDHAATVDHSLFVSRYPSIHSKICQVAFSIHIMATYVHAAQCLKYSHSNN